LTDLDVIQRYLGRRLSDKELRNFGQFMMTQVGKATLIKARKELTFSRRRNKAAKAANKPAKRRKTLPKEAGQEFLDSFEWRRLRMQALKKHGARCQCCGATPADGAKMNVDHIKPRRFFPELALSLDNLQVLCDACNHGKGNWDMTDWRSTGDVSNAHEAQT
jgi:5-methylcytosine-specific restriction endonuclease McrA